MELSEFKEKAAVAEFEHTIDVLCLNWLKQYSTGHGYSGEIAVKLVEIVEEIIAP